jgi:hypothetical protein
VAKAKLIHKFPLKSKKKEGEQTDKDAIARSVRQQPQSVEAKKKCFCHTKMSKKQLVETR